MVSLTSSSGAYITEGTSKEVVIVKLVSLDTDRTIYFTARGIGTVHSDANINYMQALKLDR